MPVVGFEDSKCARLHEEISVLCILRAVAWKRTEMHYSWMQVNLFYVVDQQAVLTMIGGELRDGRVL